jgi:osmoprotectant transport system ATP-binding protein
LMLMDEPFGAIDPINRDRLQNEFLRLQAQVKKTVVFVTHDIDEAIKMGDRIAILREGGTLVQYDSPDAILANPANDFVAQFVGADRGLKRLSLARLADIDLDPAPSGGTNGQVSIASTATLREALSLMMTEDMAPLAVTRDDAVIGQVSIERINQALSEVRDDVPMLQKITDSGAETEF